MQKPSLQTILVSVLIIVALFTSVYFPYKWKQLSNDFLDQTSQYGELLKQINDLQKEVRELKKGDGEVEKLPNENLEIDEKEETDEIDTSNWKTYRNEEYGFEVKYPKDWRFIENFDSDKLILGFKEKISLVSPYEWKVCAGGPPVCVPSMMSFEIDFTIYEKSKAETMSPCGTYDICEETIIGNNISAFTRESVTPVSYFALFYIPKDQFFISIQAVNELPLEENKTFNQILSSFKFIE